MSRVGRKVIAVPANVKVSVSEAPSRLDPDKEVGVLADDAPEASDDDVLEAEPDPLAGTEAPLETVDVPRHLSSTAPLPTADEALEDFAEPEEVQEVWALPPSRLNPWFAQIAHGHCPPEGGGFSRHAPPTTFPGRDAKST